MAAIDFLALPFIISVVLAFFAVAGSKTRYSCLVSSVGALVLFVGTRQNHPGVMQWLEDAIPVAFLPSLCLFGASRVPVIRRHPMSLFAIGPVSFWLGWVVGMNIWFGLGNSK